MNDLYSGTVIRPWLDKSPKYMVEITPPVVTIEYQPTLTNYSKVKITNTGYADLPILKFEAGLDFVVSPEGDSTVIHRGKSLTLRILYKPLQHSDQPKSQLKVKYGCGVLLETAIPIEVLNQ